MKFQILTKITKQPIIVIPDLTPAGAGQSPGNPEGFMPWIAALWGWAALRAAWRSQPSSSAMTMKGSYFHPSWYRGQAA